MLQLMTIPIDHIALYPLDAQTIEPEDVFMSLRPAEKAFVDAYLATLGDSAKAAGIALVDAVKRAEAHGITIPVSGRGTAMLANPRVQAAISQRARQICAKFEVDQNALIKEVANIAFSNLANYQGLDEDGIPYWDFRHVTFAQMSAIKSMTIEELETSAAERAQAEMTGERVKPRRKIKVELHSKLDAQEKLMKFLQMYAPERVEHHVTVQAAVVTANMTPEQLADMYQARLKASA
jgi:hypothetical protein